jgi:curved DNA-binding protein CbpA
MPQWFLKDARGAILGPLEEQAAVSIARERPGVFVSASNDGGYTFRNLKRPSMIANIAQEQAADRTFRETNEASRLELELDRLRELEPWQLFGVPKGSDPRVMREGFLSLAKRYHPGRLPKDSAQPLLKVHMDIYQYLMETQARVEERHAQQKVVVEDHLSKTWSLSELHLERRENGFSGKLSVTRKSAMVFTAHRLMNLKNHAAFFPILPPLKLGTRLWLQFYFEDAQRSIEAHCAVAFENLNASSKELQGFGVRIDGLKPEETGFMLREAARLCARA